MLRRTLVLGLGLAAAATALPVEAQAPATRRIRAEITSVTPDALGLKTREGDAVTVKLAPGYSVAAVVPATMADAKAGTFIGTAAMGPKDNLRALEVLIFPEAMRGSGEGHYPWDLMPESSMTNATIEAESAGGNGRELTLVAKGERLKVTVPPDAPIVTFAPGTPAMLVPGAKVIITAQVAADGTLSASRVAVGKDGLTPPM